MAPLWMVTPATVFDVVVFHAIAVEKSRWMMAPLFTTVPLALPASLDKMSLSRHPRALTGSIGFGRRHGTGTATDQWACR